MKRYWYLLLLPLVAGVLLAVFFGMNESHDHVVSPADDTSVNDRSQERSVGPAPAAEGDALASLRAHAETAGAKSTDRVFLDALDSPDQALRSEGFKLALSLARVEGQEAETQLVMNAAQSAAPDLRTKAFIAARQVKDERLTQILLDSAPRPGAEGDLALDALALSGDSRAADYLCELASSEHSPRGKRIRAVALLSQVDDERVPEILVDLKASQDPDLAKVANASLDAYRARK